MGRDGKVSVDLVLLGGTVLTMDGDRTAQALAVDGGVIAHVGSAAEIGALAGPETEVVHLAGRAVIPGFIDAHNHFSMTTFEPVSVDCSIPPLEGKRAVLDAIAAAAQDAVPGQWIWGLGYRARMGTTTTASLPEPLTRGDLDEVAPENPVIVMASSYHACFANSAALALAGVDEHSVDPDGGEIVRDAAGKPTGVLWERAMDPLHLLSMRAHIDRYGEEVMAGLIERNARRHLAHGITSVGDAQVMPESAKLYRSAEQQGKLPITIHEMRGGTGFFAEPAEAARGDFLDDSPTDRLRGGTVKIFMDPAHPSTARTRIHPDGTQEHIGRPYYTPEAAARLVRTATDRGLQVAIHALGNWAVELALDAIEPVASQAHASDLRPRIEHFSLASLDQIRRASALGVIVNVQPPFLYRSTPQMEASRAELGVDRSQVPLRTLLDEGVQVAASSDSPCAPLPPLLGLYSIVSRHVRTGVAPIAPEEAVSVLEGIRAYTMGSAYAMSREREVGSLEPGKRADMVVLSHDPMNVSPEEIREIEVRQTYVGGQLLYDQL